MLETDGFMLEVFDFREVFHWWSRQFDRKHMIIEVNKSGMNPIPVKPLTFWRMLQLPNRTKSFNSTKIGSFLDIHRGSRNMLSEWLIWPLSKDTKVGKVEIQEMVKPLQEIT